MRSLVAALLPFWRRRPPLAAARAARGPRRAGGGMAVARRHMGLSAGPRSAARSWARAMGAAPAPPPAIASPIRPPLEGTAGVAAGRRATLGRGSRDLGHQMKASRGARRVIDVAAGLENMGRPAGLLASGVAGPGGQARVDYIVDARDARFPASKVWRNGPIEENHSCAFCSPRTTPICRAS